MRDTCLADLLALAVLRQVVLSSSATAATRSLPLTIRRLSHDVPDLPLVDLDPALRGLDERGISRVALALALALEFERSRKFVDTLPGLFVSRREHHRVRSVNVSHEPPDLLLERGQVDDAVR